MRPNHLNSAAYAALAGHPSGARTERWLAGLSAIFPPRLSYRVHGPASAVLVVSAGDRVDPDGVAITDFMVGQGKSRQLRALISALAQTVPRLDSRSHPNPDSPPVALTDTATARYDEGGENEGGEKVGTVEVRGVDGRARFIARGSFLSVPGCEDEGTTVLAVGVQTAASSCAWCAHRTLAEILVMRVELPDRWARIEPLAPGRSRTVLFGDLDPFRSCTAILRAPGPAEVAEVTRLLIEAGRGNDA